MKREKIKLDKWWLGRERRRSKESNIEKREIVIRKRKQRIIAMNWNVCDRKDGRERECV